MSTCMRKSLCLEYMYIYVFMYNVQLHTGISAHAVCCAHVPVSVFICLSISIYAYIVCQVNTYINWCAFLRMPLSMYVIMYVHSRICTLCSSSTVQTNTETNFFKTNFFNCFEVLQKTVCIATRLHCDAFALGRVSPRSIR
jgi:hypothetical protein